MNRSAVVAGLSAFGLLAFAVLWLEGWPDRARPPGPPLELRLGLSVQPDAALLMLAEDRGFFEAEGLRVASEDFPSGTRAIEDGLRTGRVDVVVASQTPVAAAVLDGAELRMLAQLASADNINRIVARRDRGIVSLGDLGGKRLATQRGSAVHYFLHLVLRQQGVAEQDADLRFMKAEELPLALAEGRIDAFSMREPYVSQAVMLLGDNAVVLAAPGLFRQFGLMVADAAWLEGNQEAAVRLLRALKRAETFVRDEPELANGLLALRFNVTAATMSGVIQDYRLELGLAQSLLLSLEQETTWIRAEATIPNFLPLLDSRPLARVKPDAITYIH